MQPNYNEISFLTDFLQEVHMAHMEQIKVSSNIPTVQLYDIMGQSLMHQHNLYQITVIA